ncbi:hypothetical protein [Terrimonas pollutisoli]|uniref:hypothetical protein n=1 Tax=Terrimonas pollutisoli TaxID=3034147 RepID=UPI0023ED9B33|nr:hypothetical protein [Terrimonas sp. H1YJ31]
MQYITILDYIILPFILLLVYALAYNKRNKKYPHGHPWRKYYIPALSVKIFGAIFIGMIYQYYYGAGDTFNYFRFGKVINSSINDSFIKWVNLLLHIPGYYDVGYYEYTSQIPWYNTPTNYIVCAITAFISFLTGGTYLPAAVIFAYISFSGVWALFRTFASLYPRLTRPISFAVLFIPSTFIWGSGIFKDTICMFGLGWLTYACSRFLIQKDFSLKNVLIASCSLILVAKIKVYILLGFLPALAMWILFVYTQKIKSYAVRLTLKLGIILIILGGSSFFLDSLGEEYLGRYSLENIENTAEGTRRWITYSSGDEGSSYSLGDFAPTTAGMLAQFPLAVNVTLFRPYLWESGKIIVLLSAIEAALFLLLTLKVMFIVGLKRTWTTISKNPTIQFCLIFSIIFAFAVGVTSYNFGALSRYKIPALPFYALAMLLIYYQSGVTKGKPLFKFLGI